MIDLFQRAITIRIIRSEQNMFVTLTPRKNWGGRGMLGYLFSSSRRFPLINIIIFIKMSSCAILIIMIHTDIPKEIRNVR